MKNAVDDRDLMLRYKLGETAAFDQLYSRHKGPLYRYCLRQCHDPDTAAELFQEVWARIVKGRARYEPLARFTTWLYQVAHNAWVDHVRKAVRRPTLVGSEPHGERPSERQAEAVAPQSAGPRARAQAGQTVERVLAAVEALPPEQREVFLLRHETDLTIEEIGNVTGVNRETAKSRLRYAMKKLRTDLGQALGDAADNGEPGMTAGLAGEPT